MKYLLLAYGNEDKCTALTKGEMAALAEKCNAYDAELHATGKILGGMSLSWTAKKMVLQGGKLTVTDGPYIDTKELVGGLVLFEADTFEEAVKIASLHPAARMGEELGWAIELRPLDHCALKKEALERSA